MPIQIITVLGSCNLHAQTSADELCSQTIKLGQSVWPSLLGL